MGNFAHRENNELSFSYPNPWSSFSVFIIAVLSVGTCNVNLDIRGPGPHFNIKTFQV